MKGRKGLEMVISSFMTKVSLLWKVSHPHVHSLEKVHFKSKLLSVTTELLSDRFYVWFTQDFWENTHTGCEPCSHWPVNLSVWLLTCRLFPSCGCVSVDAGLPLTHLRVLALITFSTCSCFPTTVCFWSSCRPAKELEGAFEPLAGREEVGWKRKGHLGVEREEQVWHEAVIAHQNTSYLHTKQTKLCVLKEAEQAWKVRTIIFI